MDQAIHKYQSVIETVFSETSNTRTAKFKHTALEEAVKRCVTESPLKEDSKAPLFRQGNCKTFVVAIRYQGLGSSAVRMRTYNCRLDFAFPAPIWKVARATTAAPTFFDPIAIDGVVYGDGGTGWNNPTTEAIAEAHALWPGREIGCIVSIGTGLESSNQLGVTQSTSVGSKIFTSLAPKASFKIQVAKYCVASATSCEKIHHDVSTNLPYIIPYENYFRFNVPQGMSDIGLEEWKKIGEVVSMTQDYMDKGDVRKWKSVVAAALRQGGEGQNL